MKVYAIDLVNHEVVAGADSIDACTDELRAWIKREQISGGSFGIAGVGAVIHVYIETRVEVEEE